MMPDGSEIRKKADKLEAGRVAIGEELLQVRGLLSPEQFTAWVKTELDWDMAEADRYIQAAQRARVGEPPSLTMFKEEGAG